MGGIYVVAALRISGAEWRQWGDSTHLIMWTGQQQVNLFNHFGPLLTPSAAVDCSNMRLEIILRSSSYRARY